MGFAHSKQPTYRRGHHEQMQVRMAGNYRTNGAVMEESPNSVEMRVLRLTYAHTSTGLPVGPTLPEGHYPGRGVGSGS